MKDRRSGPVPGALPGALPGHEARQWKLLFLVDLAFGLVGLALVATLPGAPELRTALVVVVLFVYLPLAAFIQLVLPGPPAPWTAAWWLVLVVNCGLVAMFQGAFPAVQAPMLLGYMLLVVVGGHLYGLWPALAVAAGAETAAVVAHVVGAPGVTNPFILAMLALMLGAAAYLVGGLAGERWHAYAKLEHARSDFMSMVSHELRTPIAGIQGFASLLANHWDRLPDRERHELVAKIRSNARYLDDLVARLLDISRLDEGRFTIWREPCDLRQSAADAVDRLGAVLGPREVRVSGPPTLARVDRLALERILDNLLTNAAKFSPAEDVVEVEVGTGPAGAFLSVRDHGPGVPDDERTLVFERFYRSPNAQAPGTGLGLALVRRLVELHGGTVEVREASPGARFVVTFPPSGDAAAAPEPEPEPASEREGFATS